MTTLNSVCDALAAQIVAQLPVEVNVYASPLDDPRYPYVMMRPGTPFATYSQSFSPGAMTTFYVVLEISASGRTEDSYRQCFDLLDVGVGTTSVPDAVMTINAATGKADLGGVIAQVFVQSADEVTQPADLNAVFHATVQIILPRSTS